MAAILSGIKGACALGMISFAGGILAWLVLFPDANTGPMLGMFFTGPLGALLGFILGFLGELVYPENSQEVSNLDEKPPNEEPSD